MEGYGELSRSITIYFRADCSELIRDRNQGVIYVGNPQLRGFFRLDRNGGTGFLVVNTVGADVTRPEAIDVQSGLTEERVQELLHAAIGADIPMEVLDVANWRAEANWAERFREGRVFLAGDAAHVVPPNGGYGGNTGSRTRTTSPGSSRRSFVARPGRRCSTPTTPSAAPSVDSSSPGLHSATRPGSSPSAAATTPRHSFLTFSSRSGQSCARRR